MNSSQLTASPHQEMPSVRSTEQRPYDVLLLLFALVACVTPFWSTSLPPSTDLPQHLSQIRFLEEIFAGEHPELDITPWFYPNTLIYWPLYVFWKLTDPFTSGRLILSMLAATWLCATWVLCQSRKRATANWLIATPLVFNFLFSWGLLNFLSGWPIFCIFIVIAGAERTRFQPFLLFFAGLLLYYAHALWFAVATGWLLLFLKDQTPSTRFQLAAPLLPVWALAMVWYPKLSQSRQASGVPVDTHWEKMPLERANLSDLTDSALGSLHSDLEPLFILLLLGWLVLIVVSQWGKIENKTDKPLLLAAAMLLLGYWSLPSMYMNTIFFNQRWLAGGITLLLLSLPSPNIRKLYLNTLGIGCLIAFLGITIQGWKDWESEHLAGFFPAIAQIEKGDRLIGLNLMDGSLHVKGHPGLQLFAYAHAVQGAGTHFSFTEHFSGAVQYREAPPINPYRKLVWSPGLARMEDITCFDKVLLNANDVFHEYARKQFQLTLDSSDDAPWRLYRRNGAQPCVSRPSGSTAR